MSCALLSLISLFKSHMLVSHSGVILGWCPLFEDKRKVVTLCTRGERQEDKLDS